MVVMKTAPVGRGLPMQQFVAVRAPDPDIDTTSTTS
jgi:hypothetical protein